MCRIKTVEQLQYEPPGELGKLLGLDRVPEVRCLRHKLAALSWDDGPEKWAGQLSRDWLKAARELAGACMWTGTFASTMAARPLCPNAMSLDSDCVCGGPPTTGSTTSWASRSSRSNDRSTRDCWKCLQSDIVLRLSRPFPGGKQATEIAAASLPMPSDKPHYHWLVRRMRRAVGKSHECEGYPTRQRGSLWITRPVSSPIIGNVPLRGRASEGGELISGFASSDAIRRARVGPGHRR